MKIPFYTNSGAQRKDAYKDLPAPRRSEWDAPDKYLADPGLVDAANVALVLGQPLLLTGEAGAGKTQFASNLAWELDLGEVLKFETKSTSVARDLFYTYDAIKRFQDSQAGGPKPENALPYIDYQALGRAILRTRARGEIQAYVTDEFKDEPEKARSVVLIDEIDKAPRDFPNDILNEIEQAYFRIPEIGNQKVAANTQLPPVVVITSNSEKDLPDAFLRRCIYYHIPFPNPERMRQIVENRLGAYVTGTDGFVDDALSLFYTLRAAQGGLRKNPSTAEMLGWMLALKEMAPGHKNPLADPEMIERGLSTLIKNTADQEKARKEVERWRVQRAK